MRLDTSNPCARDVLEAIDMEGQDGVIPFSRFMEISLYGPHGYYSSGKVQIGDAYSGGHFITSPQLSDGFGALLAKAAHSVWTALDKPKPFTVVEMGAGQGASREYKLLEVAAPIRTRDVARGWLRSRRRLMQAVKSAWRGSDAT